MLTRLPRCGHRALTILFLLSWSINLIDSQAYRDPARLKLDPYFDMRDKVSLSDMTGKEAGAIIRMTVEFLRDMDMKMRDVYRIEKIYVRTYDFGAGKLYQKMQNIFSHMVDLYRNSSNIQTVMEEDKHLYYVRSDVVGSLQFMLSDYNEFLSTIDLYRRRHMHFKYYSQWWEYRDKIKNFLERHQVFPYTLSTPDWTTVSTLSPPTFEDHEEVTEAEEANHNNEPLDYRDY